MAAEYTKERMARQMEVTLPHCQAILVAFLIIAIEPLSQLRHQRWRPGNSTYRRNHRLFHRGLAIPSGQ